MTTTEPRAALDRLTAAFEAHLAAAAARRGDEDPAVEVAYQRLADAFVLYDESLFGTYDETTPFVLYDDVQDELDDEDDDELDDEDELDEDDDLEDDDELDDEFEDDDELEDVPAERR